MVCSAVESNRVLHIGVPPFATAPHTQRTATTSRNVLFRKGLFTTVHDDSPFAARGKHTNRSMPSDRRRKSICMLSSRDKTLQRCRVSAEGATSTKMLPIPEHGGLHVSSEPLCESRFSRRFRLSNVDIAVPAREIRRSTANPRQYRRRWRGRA